MRITPHLFLAILLVFSVFSSVAQVAPLDWVVGAGSTSAGATTVNDIRVNAFGHLYVAGGFQATKDFDPGPAVSNGVSAGGYDGFVVRMDTLGNLDWWLKFGGSGFWDVVHSIDTDLDGNIYVTGTFEGTMDLNPGAGVDQVSSVGGNADIYLVKLDSNGNYIWGHAFQGSTVDEDVWTLKWSADGHVFIGGSFKNTMDFDPSPGVYQLNAGGFNDKNGFIVKLTENGDFVWARAIGGDGIENSVFELDVDPTGYVLAVGHVSGTGDFDPGPAVYNYTTQGHSDCFLIKLMSDGDLSWVKFIGGIAPDDSYAFAVDHLGQVYWSGTCFGEFDIDPGSNIMQVGGDSNHSAFMVKLDSLGQLMWANVNTAPPYARLQPRTLELDVNGQPFLGGHYTCDSSIYIDFDPGPGQDLHTGFNDQIIYHDSYIQKFDDGGNSIWSAVFGGPTQYDAVRALDIDQLGNVYATGHFTETTDFQFGPGVHLLSTNAQRDHFVMKLFPSYNSAGLISDTSCNTYTVPSGQATYITSGVYKDTLENASGQDSVLTIVLTIASSSSSNLSDTACQIYESPSGNHWWTMSGVYQDTLVNVMGCDSVITIDLHVITIDTTVISIQNLLIAQEPQGQYQWLDCLSGYAIMANETNDTLIPDFGGFYAVAIEKEGCMDTSDCFAAIPIGIGKPLNSPSIELYPNPTSGLVTLSASGTKAPFVVTIRDPLGRLIGKPSVLSDGRAELFIEGEKGIYFLEVFDGVNRTVLRVVKE